MDNSFSYTIFIRTAPETLWLALTEPVITQQWWGVSFYSDWNEGSTIDVEMRDVIIHDDEQVVLSSIPFQRLAFTWHTFSEEWALAHDFSEQMRSSFAREPRSAVHYDLEQIGENTRLNVLHDGFIDNSVVLANVRQGWPPLLSSLKSFVETGAPLKF